jgi:raffinose/stachyose/melibiose transport system permease protein
LSAVRLPRRERRESSRVLTYMVLIALAAFSIGPLIVLAFNSLKPSTEFGTNPLGPPSDPQFANFTQAWTQGELGTTILNSAILTLGTVAGICVIAGGAAYALARLDLPGRNSVLVYLFTVSALPFQLYVVPVFFLWSKLGLVDSLFGLIVIYWAVFSPLATLLLRSYFLQMPREFEEAARVDGATELTVLLKVVLPLSWPGFLTIALVSGLATWNEFFLAVTFIQDQDLKPVTTSFMAFKGEFTRDWGLTSAAGMIIVLPVVLLFLALQRRFIAGLTAGGLKG